MLEGILLTIVLSYVFGFIAIKIIGATEREMTPEQRQRLIQEQLSKPEP